VFLTANAFGSSAEFGGLSVPLPGGRRQYFARYDTDGNPQAAISFGSPTTISGLHPPTPPGFMYAQTLTVIPIWQRRHRGSGLCPERPWPALLHPALYCQIDSNGNPLWARNGVSSDLANFRGIGSHPTAFGRRLPQDQQFHSCAIRHQSGLQRPPNHQ